MQFRIRFSVLHLILFFVFIFYFLPINLIYLFIYFGWILGALKWILLVKESTIDAELIGASERSGHGGLQVYEFEYKVDSSRGGLKRIFSAAFVASKKLYLLNITHSDKPESPLDTHTRMMLEEVLHSFDAAPTT